ncbi:hypothetical protein CYMTET_49253 [Cymbomonas tetramitiformis]|uniref:procollagen-proline 4-dioxygenase n=1 Tax=Cymbomonas tetramitiformis TaxID=36881 RepID=A0AAE0BQK1_9CHLO|nr:hypothetical protein CYMTET_49253 [Cymbomonas tetramitiformis]
MKCLRAVLAAYYLSSVALLVFADVEERLVGWQGEQIRQEPLDAGKKRWNMEVVSWAPRAFVFHNFLTEEECDHMIKIATPSMTKSTVVDNKTGKSVPSSIRTSSGTFFRKSQDSVIAGVERKIAEASMVPAENGEGLQILHYDVGQKYESHYDFFHDKFNNDPSKGGQRVATMLMYLSTPESGGETVFPASKIKPDRSGGLWSDCARRGASVKAKKGDALLFWSLTVSNWLLVASISSACLHACLCSLLLVRACVALSRYLVENRANCNLERLIVSAMVQS